MAHEILAPWAERVPDTSPITADALLHLPDDGWRYEVVDGELVRMPPPGYQHGRLGVYADAHGLGEVLGAETGLLLSRPGAADTVLAPDVAFVGTERVPATTTPDLEKYLRLAPDLVVEVASPSQYTADMASKAAVYLAAGVRLAWIVWPATQSVDVWRPGDVAPTATVTRDGALDGLEVVPGFSYPLAEFFA
ncbi:MAG: Uma2 family endonuclease [Ktedonobacterales bacterium]|jgi:Uma2 family endonuclease